MSRRLRFPGASLSGVTSQAFTPEMTVGATLTASVSRSLASAFDDSWSTGFEKIL
jgi:hypothetical protein